MNFNKKGLNIVRGISKANEKSKD
jgi:hypothetical protein